MRITTSMVQRNVLSDLNMLSEKLARTQGKASSGKEISRPSDDPFGAAKAIGLRQSLEANDQYMRNIDDAQGWQDATEAALDSITDYVNRARDLLMHGATDTSDDTSRIAIASEIDQIIQGVKETANATYGDNVPDVGHRDRQPRRTSSAPTTPTTATRRPRPGVAGRGARDRARRHDDDQHGRARAPRRRARQPGDGRLLNALRDVSAHLKANDGAALRTQRHAGAEGPARHAARGPRAQRLADEPPRGRARRACARSRRR